MAADESYIDRTAILGQTRVQVSTMKKKLVVYTVMVGDREPFNEAVFGHANPGYDRILFTDNKQIRADSCIVRYIDTNDLDPPRASRRAKLMPHRYLQEYEWSLYIDNNAILKSNPLILLEEIKDKGDVFFAFSHPQRKSIYDEAEAVIDLSFDDESRVREQMDHYRRLGYSDGIADRLIAAGFLFRKHHDPGLISVSEEWYEHILRFSKRDQLSFNFVAWRRNFEYGVIPGDIRDNSYVIWPAVPWSDRICANFDEAFYRWLNPDLDTKGITAYDHYRMVRDAGKSPRVSPHRWRLKQLANKYRSDKGNLYFNAHNYADVYEYILRHRRQEALRILEIGLLRHDMQARIQDDQYEHAPSLQMWREYLPNATIYGFDVADFSRVPDMPGVQILQGDMGSREDLDGLIRATGGEFDIIIDDASHASHHQQVALSELFHHLKPGGVYFIEDLHYQPAALEKKDLHKTVDILKGLEQRSLLSTKYIDQSALRYIQQHLKKIEFYDSGERVFGVIQRNALAALFRKSDAAEGKPGKETIYGIARRVISRLGIAKHQ